MKSFKAGDVIDDRYEVLCQLGEGGMGKVYKVNDRMRSRVFALKILANTDSPDEEILKRFITKV